MRMVIGDPLLQSIYVDANPQNLRISELEYFWGTNDPGKCININCF